MSDARRPCDGCGVPLADDEAQTVSLRRHGPVGGPGPAELEAYVVVLCPACVGVHWPVLRDLARGIPWHRVVTTGSSLTSAETGTEPGTEPGA